MSISIDFGSLSNSKYGLPKTGGMRWARWAMTFASGRCDSRRRRESASSLWRFIFSTRSSTAGFGKSLINFLLYLNGLYSYMLLKVVAQVIANRICEAKQERY
jgi:hypothetical protein